MVYLYLLIAILAEVVGTTALKASEGFTRIGPSIGTVAGYAVAFYFLALVLKSMPVGVAYAIWSGVGITLVALVGYFVFKQSLDLPAIIGMALIVVGIIVINAFSKSAGH